MEDGAALVASLGEGLRSGCQAAPGQVAYAFVGGDGRVRESVTRGELAQQVQRLAHWLAGQGQPGDRVLLALPAGLDFARAFWACMVAGRVAVPIPAPEATRLRHAGPRIEGVVMDCDAQLVLTTDALLAAAQELVDTAALGRATWKALPQASALPPVPAATTFHSIATRSRSIS